MTRPGLFLFQTIIFEKYLNSKAITNALLLTLLLKAIYAITKGITFSTFRNFNGILKPSLIKTGQEWNVNDNFEQLDKETSVEKL